ncbi:MAG: hypothetical protein KatS3mg011_1025 [Acidimicrobiia bacterium]|nr:MAG: hypothetical protein KatS3mg011_1025 [Acidimicrobiia bacterium]
MRRIVALGVFLSVLTALAAPAVAQEEPADQPTTTTVAESSGYQPAVTVPPPSSPSEELPWTARYLIPTGLVLAALIVFVTVVQYFLRVVRSRYKVVE